MIEAGGMDTQNFVMQIIINKHVSLLTPLYIYLTKFTKLCYIYIAFAQEFASWGREEKIYILCLILFVHMQLSYDHSCTAGYRYRRTFCTKWIEYACTVQGNYFHGLYYMYTQPYSLANEVSCWNYKSQNYKHEKMFAHFRERLIIRINEYIKFSP